MKTKITAVLGAVVAAIAVAVYMLMTGGSLATYDEAAHRAAYEKDFGKRLTDAEWAEYLNKMRNTCQAPVEGIQAIESMNNTFGETLEDEFAFLCPERIDDLH